MEGGRAGDVGGCAGAVVELAAVVEAVEGGGGSFQPAALASGSVGSKEPEPAVWAASYSSCVTPTTWQRQFHSQGGKWSRQKGSSAGRMSPSRAAWEERTFSSPIVWYFQ